MASGHVLPEQRRSEPRWTGLAFAVGDLKLLIELTSVVDVLVCPPLTPVPGTKSWLRGVCNVRGTLFSVVDLGVFLNVAPPADGDGRLLVINDKELGCTLLVSRVFGLRNFMEEQQRGEISALDPAIQPYAEQVFVQEEETWGVLDLGRLVATDEFLNIESGAVASCN